MVHLSDHRSVPLHTDILRLGGKGQPQGEEMVPYRLGNNPGAPLLQLLHRPLPLGLMRLEPVRSALLFCRLQRVPSARSLPQGRRMESWEDPASRRPDVRSRLLHHLPRLQAHDRNSRIHGADGRIVLDLQLLQRGPDGHSALHDLQEGQGQK